VVETGTEYISSDSDFKVGGIRDDKKDSKKAINEAVEYSGVS
jgi:hypothetical protein